MRNLWLALAFLFLFLAPARAQPTTIGPGNAILCNLATPVNVGVSGVTQILPAIANQRIVICGWQVTNTAVSGTIQLSYGTGSNCATGNTTLTPVMSVGNTALTDHTGFAILQTPLSQALCANPSVATISAIIWTAQFQ